MTNYNDVPRLALRWPAEVAAALGVGDDFVKRHGLIAELRCVRRGSQRFVPVSELERWLAENAHLPLDIDQEPRGVRSES